MTSSTQLTSGYYDDVDSPTQPPAYANPDYSYAGSKDNGGYSEPYGDARNGNDIPMRPLQKPHGSKENLESQPNNTSSKKTNCCYACGAFIIILLLCVGAGLGVYFWLSSDEPTQAMWSDWYAWSECLSANAGCLQTRSRQCLLDNKETSGCTGEKKDEQLCDFRMCADWTDWGLWTPCSAECVRSRIRRCFSGGVQVTGCSGNSTRSESCSGGVDCPEWTSWDAWGSCSESCCGGEQVHRRKCISRGVEATGCTGAKTETIICNTQECPSWNDWESWDTCSASCCGGQQSRSRSCISCGKTSSDCIGSVNEMQDCNEQPCIDWGSWESWNSCSASCCTGQQSRSRTCLTCGAPSNDCNVGAPTDTQECMELTDCPDWTFWGAWGTCSAAFCSGQQSRFRGCLSCDTPSSDCLGESTETQSCEEQGRPEWTSWTSWNACTASCCGGQQTRSRSCLSCGEDSDQCVGDSSQMQNCNEHGCPEWKPWGSWGTCSATCCGGEQMRSRICESCGKPSSFCIGTTDESRTCNQVQCPVWSSWGVWSTCSATACGGQQTRTRTCMSCGDSSTACPGSRIESRTCNTQQHLVWSSWGAWSTCSATACGGQQTRTRACASCGDSSNACPGSSSESQSCNTQEHPVWSSWSTWSSCSATACGGQQTRTRTCTSCGDSSNACPGSSSESRSCNTQEHPVSSSWGAWSTCSATACGGQQTRTRTCISCGDPSTACSGSSSESQACNTQNHIAWTSWGSWSACSVTCDGNGVQTRSRTCRNCNVNSNSCTGSSSDSKTCYNGGTLCDCNSQCENGSCENNYCRCFPGWGGTTCDYCYGGSECAVR